jgi:hypothetical protein
VIEEFHVIQRAAQELLGHFARRESPNPIGVNAIDKHLLQEILKRSI